MGRDFSMRCFHESEKNESPLSERSFGLIHTQRDTGCQADTDPCQERFPDEKDFTEKVLTNREGLP
jgi:hypothetical protein